MENVIRLYLSAEEILAPILSHARALGLYDGRAELLLGKPISEVQEAVSFLRNGCEAKYLPAQVMLGECLYRGIGVKKDNVAAHALFVEATSAEYPLAQFYLGRMYEHGDAGLPVDYIQAADFYRKAASYGNSLAQHNLGWMYANGRGVEKDDSEAVKWYRKAAEQGEAKAQRNLGWMYANGTGVEKDEAEAVRWIRKAAEQGDAAAQRNLGIMYANGTGVEKDEAEAVRWIRKASEQGDATAQRNLAIMYANGTGVEKDDAEAVKWYRKAAEQGDATAQRNLAIMYANGTGVEKDDAEAIKWYRKAAEQGVAEAQRNLGIISANGTGVEKDEAEAIKWYRKAAEQGDAWAQNNLGLRYYHGTGVEKDEAEAVRWIRKAAEQGVAEAQRNLGIISANGTGVEKDEAEAIKWYRKAAEQGDATAQRNLGIMYANGRGVEKNEAEAVKWYRKAAEQGLAIAQYSLGLMYANGRGVEKDEAEAIKWYRKAAEQGNADAQHSLGWMYANGRGVEKDEAEAVKWYRKAAEQGNAGSLNNLGLMYENGNGVVKNVEKALALYRDGARKGGDAAKTNLARLEALLNRNSLQTKSYIEETDEAVSRRAKAVLAKAGDGGVSEECNPLMEVCNPSLYFNNAFRIVGLHVDATPRDIRRRTEDLKAVEGTVDWEREHRHALPIQTPPTPEAVQNAILRLQDPERRLVDEFFWFWPLGSAECKQDRALKHFLLGERDQAYSIWLSAASTTAAADSIPAIHNLAVYYHLLAIEGEWIKNGSQEGVSSKSSMTEGVSKYWIQALGYWERVVDDDVFWERVSERVRAIGDPRLSPAFVDAMQSVFPLAFDQINAIMAGKYAEAGRVDDARRHIQYMSQSHQGLDDVDHTISTIFYPIEKRVKLLGRNALDRLHKKPEAGLKIAKEFLMSTREPLEVARGLLENGHAIRQSLCEEVANVGFSCLIDYGNKTGDWKPCIEMLSKVENIAETAETKKRIRDNREIAIKNLEEKELRETCWFCKKTRASSGAEYVVSMHGDVQRDYLAGKVTWRTLDVKVPRCKACQTAHQERASWIPSKTGSIFGFIIGSIIWVVGISAISEGDAFPAAVITCFIGGAIGCAIGSAANETEKNRPPLPGGISYEANAVSYPDVKNMRDLGLNLGEKPPSVY